MPFDPHHPVFSLVAQIPQGKVTTYGLLALACGVKNPRYVGYLLHRNPDPESIPCHRVVSASGRCAPNFAFGLATAQAQLLEAEGVHTQANQVDLKHYLWTPPSAS